MKLSWRLASILHVASILALGAALVPVLASPAVAKPTIVQSAPFSGSTTTVASAGFTDQLLVTGGDGDPITFSVNNTL